ncbi:MAG: hypothetical protein RL748_2845 [Pseudomonadota bacterium]
MQKVLVFDDHQVVFDGIRMQIGDAFELHYAATGEQLRQQMQAMQFDAVIVDLDFPDNDSGFNYLAELKAGNNKVIVLTGTATDAKLRRCFDSNLDGLIEKHDANADLRRTLSTVLAGQQVFPFTRIQRLLAADADRLPRLTARERDVLDRIMLDPGLSLKQIGAQLTLSESRISRLIDQLASKFGVDGLPRIYREAQRRGYQSALGQAVG